MAPPPRYSTVSSSSEQSCYYDDGMSTSSATLESPPSSTAALLSSIMSDSAPATKETPVNPVLRSESFELVMSAMTEAANAAAGGKAEAEVEEEEASSAATPVPKEEDSKVLMTPAKEEADSTSKVLMTPTKEEAAAPADSPHWQARCIELEDSLQKFRDQAHGIRELLREKVGILHALKYCVV